MNWILRSIRNKLLIICGIGTFIVLVAAALGMLSERKDLAALTTDIKLFNTQKENVLMAHVLFIDEVREWKNLLLRGTDTEEINKRWEKVKENGAKANSLMKEAGEKIDDPATRQLIEQFLNGHAEMEKRYAAAVEFYRNNIGNTKDADHMVSGVDRPIIELLKKTASSLDGYAHRALAHAEQKSQIAILYTMGAMLIGCVIGFALFVWLCSMLIIKPANRLIAAMNQLAKGDFRQTIVSDSQDEIGLLANAAESVRRDIGSIVSTVKQSGQDLAQAADQVAKRVHEVEQATSEQSDSTGNTAASIEQMSSAAESVRHNASEANESTRNSLEQTEQAQKKLNELQLILTSTGQIMSEVATATGNFAQSARQITAITQQVRDIADQTNLLALNAAIEAARAGEQGRGFAVVADEVRKLAEKSGSSAGEIDRITTALSAQAIDMEKVVAKGTDAVGSSSGRMQEVTQALEIAGSGVRNASHEVESIYQSVQEQSTATSHISDHIQRVAEMADMNHHAIRHIMESSEALKALSARLDQAISGIQSN